MADFRRRRNGGSFRERFKHFVRAFTGKRRNGANNHMVRNRVRRFRELSVFVERHRRPFMKHERCVKNIRDPEGGGGFWGKDCHVSPRRAGPPPPPPFLRGGGERKPPPPGPQSDKRS